MDTHRKCIYSSCYCCIIKVSSMNISGLFLPPPPNLKLGGKNQRKKNPFPPSPPDSSCPCLLLKYLYNPVISLFIPLSPSDKASPTEAVLCLLWVLVQASWSCPVSGHGRCTLPEWVTGGPLENPGKRQYLLPGSGGSRSLQTSLWTPRPSSPLPLENWKEEYIPLLTEGCLSCFPRTGYRQVFVS